MQYCLRYLGLGNLLITEVISKAANNSMLVSERLPGNSCHKSVLSPLFLRVSSPSLWPAHAVFSVKSLKSRQPHYFASFVPDSGERVATRHPLGVASSAPEPGFQYEIGRVEFHVLDGTT